MSTCYGSFVMVKKPVEYHLATTSPLLVVAQMALAHNHTQYPHLHSFLLHALREKLLQQSGPLALQIHYRAVYDALGGTPLAVQPADRIAWLERNIPSLDKATAYYLDQSHRLQHAPSENSPPQEQLNHIHTVQQELITRKKQFMSTSEMTLVVKRLEDHIEKLNILLQKLQKQHH